MTKPDTPFPRHWLYYIALKIAADRRRHCAGAEAVWSVVKPMGQALPKPGLRPFLPADAPMLAAIFVASIEELTGDDYSEAQQEAWASAAEDEEAFGKKLAGQLTLIATLAELAGRLRLAEGRRSYRHALCASERGGAGRRPRC